MSKNSKFNINPTDLLFTNSFISNTQSHNKANKYIKHNLTTHDDINLQKHHKTPWPTKYNSINKPILADSTQDISEEKYRKVTKTHVLLNSVYRNFLLNPIANNYELQLGKEFNNVFKIEIVDFSLERLKYPINNNTNNFGWEYPTYQSLKESNSEYTLYPSKFNNISAIPGVTSDLINCEIIYNQNSSQSVYTTKLINSFGTISDLIQNFENILNESRLNYKNFGDPNFIKTKWNNNNTFSTPDEPTLAKSNITLYKYFYRKSYTDKDPSKSATNDKAIRTNNVNYSLNIDPNTQKCFITNRLDLYPVIMLQSYRYSFLNKLLVPNDQIYNDFIITNADLFQIYIPCIYKQISPINNGFKLLTLEEYNAGWNGGDPTQKPNKPYYERFPENGENFIVTIKLPFHNIDRLLDSEKFLTDAFIKAWISYPLVFTNLEGFGSIDKISLNNTPFFNNILYHLDIFTATNFPGNGSDPGSEYTTLIHDASGNNIMPLKNYNNSKLPPFVSTWYIYDIFQVKGVPNSALYMRMACKLSNGNVNDRPLNLNGSSIISNIDLTYIFNDQFKNLVQKQDLKIVCCDASGCDLSGNDASGCDIGNHFNAGVVINNIDNNALVGRALPVKLLSETVGFEKEFNDYNGYRTSILDLLGFPNTNGYDNIEMVSMKQPYRWVNTNFQDVLIPQLYDYDENLNLNQLFNLKYPQKKINMQFSNGDYYLSSFTNLYLKLFVNGSVNITSKTKNYMIASGFDNKLTDDIYYDTIFYNKNNTNLNIYNKNNNLSNITSFIPLNNLPSSKQYTQINQVIEYYNEPINNLKSLKIQLIEPNGELFLQNEDHYINIIIYEKINVLKDTLLNTKDNTTTTTGISSIYGV